MAVGGNKKQERQLSDHGGTELRAGAVHNSRMMPLIPDHLIWSAPIAAPPAWPPAGRTLPRRCTAGSWAKMSQLV
jgi:hypothetical protein